MTVVAEGGRGGYLLAGRWKFMRLSCQIGQIFQNGLQVGHLTKHVDLMVLQHTHTYIIDDLEADTVVYWWIRPITRAALTSTGFSMVTKLQ